MLIPRFKIIDGRHNGLNIGCSFELYVNDTISELASREEVSNIKPVFISTDYFIIQYMYDTAKERDVPP